MLTAPPPAPAAPLPVRKGLARAHLNTNRLAAAVEAYAGIVRDYPDDVEAHLMLGDFYLAGGDAGAASQLYARARRIDPHNPDVRRRLSLAHAEAAARSAQAPAAPDTGVPTDPASIAGLLQRLSGRSSQVGEAEVQRAAGILKEIVNSPRPAQAVAERLSEIDALLPALLELNIRQARADGRPDLAGALEHLLMNIRLQLAEQSLSSPAPAAQPQAAPYPRVLFLGPSLRRDAFLRGPAETLRALGCETTLADKFSPDYLQRFDVVVARHPHVAPDVLKAFATGAASGMRAVLDLDADYEHLPPAHPDYAALGLNSPERAAAFAAALHLADVIRVPSEAFAESLRTSGYPALVVPDGWRQTDEWDAPAPQRETINLGWIGRRSPSGGGPGALDDVAAIRRIVTRVIREFPQTRLVVGGDPQVYRLFRALPESRCVFLPPAGPEDYPYTVAQADILLAPLNDTPFNRAASDVKLMEAGLRRIPWVASPTPAYRDWAEGGLFADTLDEWYAHLRWLIVNADERRLLGEAGRRKAETRELSALGFAWLKLVRRPG
jgi:Tfp pilus assembly protein PilF